MNARPPTFVLVSVLLLMTICMNRSIAQPPEQAVATTRPAGTGVEEGSRVTVILGESRIVQPPWPVTRVAMTNPKVADVQVLTPRQVLVQGKAIGSTDLTLWGQDEHAWHAPVRVEIDPKNLQDRLGQLFSDSRIRITQQDGIVTVEGTLSRAEQAQQLHQFLETLGLKYVDLTHVGGLQQVLLKVRMAEVSRVATRALGFNALFTGSDFFGGTTIGSDGGTPLVSTLADTTSLNTTGFNRMNFSPAVNVFGGAPEADFFFFLEALAENQYLRILAEPNLVAMSGQDASFLAGGEFPIPVVQGTGSGGGTSITIEYRKFGVQLRFRPLVLGDGTIRLHVAPEVSQLSDNGAVVLQGFRVPSLLTRRAETTLELKSRQTFAMAGLLSDNSTGRSSRYPGLGDVPILGALFRSARYQRNQTELVVLVTASLVEPSSSLAKAVAPGDAHFDPNDWEFYALGRLEGSPPKICKSDLRELQTKGLHRLKGPGAWARHEERELLPCQNPRKGGQEKNRKHTLQHD